LLRKIKTDAIIKNISQLCAQANFELQWDKNYGFGGKEVE